MTKHTLAISLTNRCPLRCSFCCVPPTKGDISDELAHRIIDEAIELGTFGSIGFTGGEPLLKLKLLSELGKKIHHSGLRWGMTTSGGSLVSNQRIDGIVDILLSSGISNITFSVDDSHLLGRDPELVKYFVESMADANIPTIVSCTSNKKEEDVTLPIELKTSKNIRVEFHYVSPVGYAKDLQPQHSQRYNMEKSKCPIDKSFTLSVWPDGIVYPCCSTYIVNKNKKLSLGNLNDLSLGDILENALLNRYLCGIREVGFSGLIALTSENEIWKDVFSKQNIDVCHVCSKVTSSDEFDSLEYDLMRLIPG